MWFETMKENYLVLRFGFDFLRLCCGDNYQEAVQLGQSIKNKHNTEDYIYAVVKNVMQDVLNDSLYCDNMKIMAIKVLAGLKSN